MMSGTCIDSLAAALHCALLVDLPPVSYQQWTPAMKRKGILAKAAPTAQRRPREDECEVHHFLQTWGSTALGFGGIGGSAMTSAYTTVVTCHHVSAVYFAGGYAYTVERCDVHNFLLDLSLHCLASRDKAMVRYHTIPSCHICGRILDQLGVPESVDCGGDCAECVKNEEPDSGQD